MLAKLWDFLQTRVPTCSDADFEAVLIPWQAMCDSTGQCFELGSADFLSAVADLTTSRCYAVVGVSQKSRLIYVEPVRRVVFG